MGTQMRVCQACGAFLPIEGQRKCGCCGHMQSDADPQPLSTPTPTPFALDRTEHDGTVPTRQPEQRFSLPPQLILLGLGCLVIALLCVTAVVLVRSGGIPKGSIQGTILDQAGTPVTHHPLTLLPPIELSGRTQPGEIDYIAWTGGDGTFRFNDVPAGTYVIACTDPDLDADTSWSQGFVRDAAGQVLYVVKVDGKGLDLGTIRANFTLGHPKG